MTVHQRPREVIAAAVSRRPPSSARPPASLRRVELDVHADLMGGHEPFARIMAAAAALAPDEMLVLRVPFEPAPLYGALAKRGLSHWTEADAPGDWSICFFRGDAAPGSVAPSTTTARAPRSWTLDVRDLEPPLPLVQVLERLDALGDDDELIVVHDRRPLFLYPQIEDRGFVHRTEEPEAGVVRIVIRRRFEVAS